MRKRHIQTYLSMLKGSTYEDTFLEFKQNVSLSETLNFLNFYYDKRAIEQYIGFLHIDDVNNLFVPNANKNLMLCAQDEISAHQLLGIEKDFRFLLAIFMKEAHTINSFIEYRTKFNTKLLCGNFEEAILILDSIDNELGLSFWTIQSRFILFELSKMKDPEYGHTAYDYYSSLHSQISSDSVDLIIRALKEKTSKNKGNRLFIDRLQTIFHIDSGLSIENDMAYQYTQMLTMDRDVEEITKNISDIGAQLALSRCVGLIDKYILVESLVAKWFCYHKWQRTSFSPECLLDFQTFSDSIACPTIINTLFGYNIPTKQKPNDSSQIQETILKHIQTQPIRYSHMLEYISTGGEMFDLVTMLAQSNRLPNSNNPIETIAHLMQLLYRGNAQESEAINILEQLDQLARLFYGTEIGYSLICFIDNVVYTRSAQKEYDRTMEMLYRRSICYESIILFQHQKEKTPLELPPYSFSRWHYYDTYQTLNMERSILQDESLSSTSLIQSQDDLTQSKIFEDLLERNERTAKEGFMLWKISESLFSKHVDRSEYETAASLYFKLNHTSPLLSVKIDYTQLNHKLCTQIMQRNSHKYFFSSYLFMTEMISKDILLKDNKYIMHSYDSTLRYNCVNSPSRLPPPKDEWELRAYWFFLRNICTLEVLRNDISRFHSTTERINERKQILNILISDKRYSIHTRISGALDAEMKDLSQIEENLTLEKLINSKIDLNKLDITSADDQISSTMARMKKGEDEDFGENYFEYENGFYIYQKYYVQRLNNLIGTNIRHAFFSSEIIRVFRNHDLYIQSTSQVDEAKLAFSKNLRDLLDFYSNPTCSKWMVVTEQPDETAISLYVDKDTLAAGFSHQIFTDLDLKASYRHILDSTAKVALEKKSKKIFQELRPQIEKLLNQHFPLQNLTLCKTDLEECLQSIQEWFVPACQGEGKIKLQALRILFRHYNKSDEGLFIADELLLVEMDTKLVTCIDFIFCNIITNAYTHSGYSDTKKIQMRLCITRKDRNLLFEFRNRVSSKKNPQKLSHKIHEIKEKIKNNEQFDLVNAESGTGYLQINQRLRQIFSDSFTMDVDFDDNTHDFVTVIIFPFQFE